MFNRPTDLVINSNYSGLYNGEKGASVSTIIVTFDIAFSQKSHGAWTSCI